MAWPVDYAAAALRDFELIFDHLEASYRTLGENDAAAVAHAVARITRLKSEIDRLGATPHIGTLRPDMGDGIRFLRRDGAAVWFRATEDQRVQVLAVFFGAQDHVRHMLVRLLSDRG